MTLTFTGIVYFPITFILFFISYRFFRDWLKIKKTEDFLYAIIFASFAVICLTGFLAGSIFALNPVWIRIMLIISSFFIAIVIFLLAYLTNFYLKISKFRFLWPAILFMYGLIVTFFTLRKEINPVLESSGGIYWGMPLYLNLLRFSLYALSLVPLIFAIFKIKIQKEKNQDIRLKYSMVISFFFFALVVTAVDFVIEPVFGLHALLSEQAIIFMAVLLAAIYFVYFERYIVRSERRLRKLVENMNDMILLLDSQGIITYSNPEQQRRLGYEKREIEGKNFLELVLEADRKKVNEYIRQNHFLTQKERLEFRLVTKMGEIIWVETSGVFLLESSEMDQGDALVLASRDITDRKQIESLLRKSEKDNRILISEIYHRTKNILAIIQAILKLQLFEEKNATAQKALTDFQRRLSSISLISRLLYSSPNLDKINLKNYLIQILKHLQKEFHVANQIFDLNLSDIDLNLELATSIGLVANEILHLFMENHDIKQKARLQLTLMKIDDSVKISIRSKNDYFPTELQIDDESNFSYKFVKSLCEFSGISYNQIQGQGESTIELIFSESDF